MSRKHKNRINVAREKAAIMSSDFIVIVFDNGYQFRVANPDLMPGVSYDWYHTSGTVVVNRQDRPAAACSVKCFTGDQLADFIIKHETERCNK